MCDRLLLGLGYSADGLQRGETDFFSGEPLRALSTLVFSDNVDLQRSASLTFAEITERGTFEESWAIGRQEKDWDISS
jgi:hypothetical protein